MKPRCLLCFLFIIFSVYDYASLSHLDLKCTSPDQIHLTLGDDLTQMVVMWATGDTNTAWVTYRISGQRDYLTSHSQIAELHSSSSALRYIHRATLKHLQEDQQYEYYVTVSCSDKQIQSNVYNFTALSNDPNKPMSTLVYGDLGITASLKSKIERLSKEIQTKKYLTIWHIGDISYHLGSYNGKTGDEFLRAIENVSAFVPYMTLPGNQELFNDFHQYRRRFSIPRLEWPIPLDKMFYSYDIGPVHFISYSTEVYFVNNQNFVQTQFDWLLKDLVIANRNRKLRPWIIAMGHRPLYCDNDNHDDCTDWWFLSGWVRHGLEDLFYAQGVDLILQGHEHSYQRTYPMYKGVPISTSYYNPRGPVHVISGAAGNREHNDKPPSRTKPFSAFTLMTKNQENSYGRLHVYNSTHLQWEQIGFSSGRTLDNFWVVQHYHGPFDHTVDCDENGNGKHSSCRCPFIFHFITVIATALIVLILCIVACVVMCVLKIRRTKKRKNKTGREPLLTHVF